MDERFLLVDDHALIRRGLREILMEAYAGAEIVEAATGHEALAHVHAAAFDLVTLDLSIPGRDGLEILKEIVGERPSARVLVLSVHAEEQYAIRALRGGAQGYITKGSAADELARAVAKILAGGKYVSADFAETLAAGIAGGGGERPLHALLSDRELQVLRLLASGRSVKEIGGSLSLSEKTVSTYRTRVIEKTGLKSNAEMMRYALGAGLVE